MWKRIGLLMFLMGLASCGGPGGNEVLTHPQEHASCNKALCASIVSYCMIQEKCGCDPRKNCSCCTECAICLGDHYMQCCDCVGETNFLFILTLLTCTAVTWTVDTWHNQIPRKGGKETEIRHTPLPLSQYAI